MQRASQAISKLQADQQTKSLIVEKYVLHSITNCVYTMLKESSEEITRHIRNIQSGKLGDHDYTVYRQYDDSILADVNAQINARE